ncbi:hypothetical protein BDFB_011999 [Asbolus verrucosus]|uniref:Uncharacterized protein n=1 Tax=Asbolus verrucosus TaxID=1661398 RepID=A0A482VES1_ASBVE|nr:hypothetical protein BDFB_011999 [Asbolus verrucosus]
MEHRTKRSLDCDDYSDESCDDCDCSLCSYTSCEKCSGNNNCCSRCCNHSSCASYNCCHQTCRAECRSNSCRTACKKKCQASTRNGNMKELTVNNTINQSSLNRHNITTVIHLNNVINNTNLISLPVTVNNTIFNNITSTRRNGIIYTNNKQTLQDNCCLTIGPRQCVPQKEFPYVRCFHIRKKACGYICSAPVVHYQKHEICDNDVNVQQPCHQQIIYVPQPQPRCAYQPSWPYVTCGNRELQSCEGCYSHYIKKEDVTRCSNFCYDDGYGIGPYYRQAPFYRPGFAHVPSCYQTGFCNGFENFEGYGEYNPNYGAFGGFPYAYPPASYPFIIEDCENCTHEMGTPWDSSNWNEPIINPLYGNDLFPPIQWSNISDKMLNIDAQIYPAQRSERYAEIKIKFANNSKEKEMSNITATS